MYGKAAATNTTSSIRQDFITFFEGKGHPQVPSSSLVPTADATLLFTAADANEQSVFPPMVAFHLLERHGLPVDVTMVMARQNGYTLDLAAVEDVIDEQRTSSRKTHQQEQKNRTQMSDKGPTAATVMRRWGESGIRSTFQDRFGPIQSVVRAVHVDEKNDVYAVLDPCPFYGESGGQVGDTGVVMATTGDTADGCTYTVVDTLTPYKGMSAVRMRRTAMNSTANENTTVNSTSNQIGDIPLISVGDTVSASVDAERRKRIAQHHTATHCLHATLRKVLGEHVVQAGSLVTPDRLRFDFTHSKALTAKQLRGIESAINVFSRSGADTAPHIHSHTHTHTHTDTHAHAHTQPHTAVGTLAHAPAPAPPSRTVTTDCLPYMEAINGGAMALFGEKYEDDVRVVTLTGLDGNRYSSELCGGSHVDQVIECFPFRILTESAVAAGTRRIEAVVGQAAVDTYRDTEQIVQRVASLVKSPNSAQVETRVQSLQNDLKESKREIDQLLQSVAMAPVLGETFFAGQYSGVEVKVHMLPEELSAKIVRLRATHLAKVETGTAHVCIHGNKLVASKCGTISKDVIHCGQLVKCVTTELGGKGGGSPTLAEGSVSAEALSAQAIVGAVEYALRM
ncbi:hypothetical protein SARC_08977 [Sphaeroforma arctica JP610]|uniref:alanine--tRNA ligase n=1 Tax=Sphaeroforma arctica JP610 TaxID=667725 RepID=A0A0L0FRK8_9EUKA|nr:hypothetical protein SARC_08977 [Sphaeroforma arctica JP610]KNC78598.1 hypothetical protein SARC_08977 [Sphaeroforma arctica JP610]|eukprot:XP_014152500.1 hypothetical protein SARC_08977 [Sphaeroforma arctica JP610]